MATFENLQAKIARLQAQAELIARNELSTVVAKIRDIMQKHGLTTADIEAHIGSSKKRGRKPGVKIATTAASAVKTKSSAVAAGKLPPKYRDPKTGATWSGHARPPQWIAGAKDRSKFLIDGSSTVSVPAAKKPAAKTGAYVRGPQPAKYRNPETGATWSGRGPAPAWLAAAKDRTTFLIAGVSEGAVEPKAAVAKKAPASAKKTAAKKTATKKAVSKKGAVKNTEAVSKKAPAKKVAAKTAVVKKAAKKPVAKKSSVSTVSGSIAPAAPETSVTAFA
ncbi:H-NS histone family protein [Paraburkholderia sp. CNPSo 3157]|uniref:H-NS histone family protein n=1 Tax=Paraburkholderia franconis TaxID=2654983 RepID=A0A7X1TLG9_9BURK|nr:H-NS family nucleoid-associated regulatory protein [Paraburkholderia franconis]MPW23488.1 H-NS histone family protein [Paraburkholderia franconis]